MDKLYLNSIAPIVSNKLVWDAFLAILSYEEGKVIAQLNGPKSSDELIRINARYTFLQHLKNLRENANNAANEFKPGG